MPLVLVCRSLFFLLGCTIIIITYFGYWLDSCTLYLMYFELIVAVFMEGYHCSYCI